MKWILVLAALSVLAGLACSAQAWQVKAAVDTDEQVVFSLCAPSVRDCNVQRDAVMAPGAGTRQPRVGQWCTQRADGILYCGRSYWLLRLIEITPVSEGA